MKENYCSIYFYPQTTTSLFVDECLYKLISSARRHPRNKADNRGVAESETGYFNGIKYLPVGTHTGNFSES
jgi:hypothetical protein